MDLNVKEVKTINLMENARTGDEVVSFVYETKDYNKFVTFRENRVPDHVGRIASNMIEYGAIQKPIVCTIHRDYPGKLVIVDGNNSFNARIQLRPPIPYIVQKEATPREMTALNLLQTTDQKHVMVILTTPSLAAYSSVRIPSAALKLSTS